MRLTWPAILLAVSCTPAPAPPKTPRPHLSFPIDAGVHAVACTSCHALTNTNYAQFECTGCHLQPATDPTHASMNAYRYASQACYGCHRDGTSASAPNPPRLTSDPSRDVRVTSLIPTWSGTSIQSVTAADEALPMQMDHASPAAALACATCHLDPQLGNFFPGEFHSALINRAAPQPASCSECHAAATPAGFVGPIATLPLRSPPTGQMKHDSVDWAGGAPTTTRQVTKDCSACHVVPATAGTASWKTGAKFHPAFTGMKIGSCLDCHANTRPGVLTSANAALPPNLKFDHQAAVWLGDCATCHFNPTTWAGGRFHHDAGTPNPPSCLPCHAEQRPAANDGGLRDPPFDFGTNAQNITHGAGQDCAVCHKATTTWAGGNFVHGPTTLWATTCVACHSTQRPAGVVSGFNHAVSGTGDCFGCHQATTAFTQLSDWAGGQTYPGASLIASGSRSITVTQIALKRGPNGLVTGTSTSQATLFNAMLHTSLTLQADAGLFAGPSPGDPTTCGRCHANAPASLLDGWFHGSLAAYRSTPDAGVTPLPQPVDRCTDCHSNMRPKDIVQKSTLQPMDHFAKTTDGGSYSLLDCSTCHTSPGGAWNDGVFHANVLSSAVGDCTTCHFTLMADAAKVDVISAASPGPTFAMKHRSPQVTFQRCDRCHPSALANASAGTSASLWAPGKFHPNLATPPGACVDCHASVTTPTRATQSAFTYKGQRQWMNHAAPVVTAKDCAACHATTWSTSDLFHRPGISSATCSICHGPANGAPGNNVPAGLVDSATLTTASAATGRAGQPDQLSHQDLNVTSRDCRFCHTQLGIADAGSAIAGEEWAQAGFHARFTGNTALVMNGTSGRCSNCHANLAPVAAFPGQDHSAFTATSATDCSACHLWPGTGTAAAPSWRRAAGAPQTISVGGFTIKQPPAANATTTQAGLNNLAHPATPAGGSCTSCHALASGGRGAFAYDHALAPSTGCAACHEAGSNLVGTPWTLNVPGAVQVGAQCVRGAGTIADRGGDTRPIGIASLACSANAASVTCGTNTCALNHFYPTDCGQCHVKPAAAPSTTTTGAPYAAAWRFQHFFGAPAQQATCCQCHSASNCRP